MAGSGSGWIWPNRPVPDPDPGPVPDPSNFLNIDEVPSIFEDGGWPVWRLGHWTPGSQLPITFLILNDNEIAYFTVCCYTFK